MSPPNLSEQVSYCFESHVQRDVRSRRDTCPEHVRPSHMPCPKAPPNHIHCGPGPAPRYVLGLSKSTRFGVRAPPIWRARPPWGVRAPPIWRARPPNLSCPCRAPAVSLSCPCRVPVVSPAVSFSCAAHVQSGPQHVQVMSTQGPNMSNRGHNMSNRGPKCGPTHVQSGPQHVQAWPPTCSIEGPQHVQLRAPTCLIGAQTCPIEGPKCPIEGLQHVQLWPTNVSNLWPKTCPMCSVGHV